MSGGGQAENTLHENAIGWMILLVVLLVLVMIFWYYQADEVRNIIRWIRYGWAWLAQWPITALENLGLYKDGLTVNFQGQKVRFWDIFLGNEDAIRRAQNPNGSGYFGMGNYDKQYLTDFHIALFNAAAMQPLRPLFVGICVLGAIWCIFRGPQTHNRSKLDLEGLIQRQAQNFPVISPFIDFNPANQPPRPPGSPVPSELPPFAEALGPEEWLAYTNNNAPDGVIDEKNAHKAFAKQLGGRWKGSKGLQPYKQILLAAFCLKASRKRDQADEILGRLALCWHHKDGLKLSRDRALLKEARHILKTKDLAALTLSKCNQHAFETTALLRALQVARDEGGVLAPAQFVWLRAHERALYYPLNNLGRQSYHMEALGAMAHYKAEKMTQRPIPLPKVDFAIDTIKEYMSSIRARPIPQLDYSQSKKRGIKKAV